MSKVAKLVEASLMVRVIVEKNATEDEIISVSRDKFINIIHTSLGYNIESIKDDVECPYEEKNKETSKILKKYDKDNNLIYYKNIDGVESWWTYDKNKNLIYFKNSVGLECWYEYDENNNEIYFKNSKGDEIWYKYDENNKYVEITEEEYKELYK